MKIILTSAAALLLSLAAVAAPSGDPVPAAVLAAFSKQFPDVKKTKWEKEGDRYEAEFKMAGKETSATFSADGQWLETETKIAVAELPQAARDYVAQHFAGKKIREAAKITASDGKVTFEAEVRNKDLIFDANGAYLNTTD